MLEEKSKIVEMMNEANFLYEGASRAKSTTMADGNNTNEFIHKQSIVGNSFEDLTNLIKPEYLDIVESTKSIENLPYEVKVKMQAHSDACTALVFNPNGDTIATGGADKTVGLWSTKTMQSKASFRSKASIC